MLFVAVPAGVALLSLIAATLDGTGLLWFT